MKQKNQNTISYDCCGLAMCKLVCTSPFSYFAPLSALGFLIFCHYLRYQPFLIYNPSNLQLLWLSSINLSSSPFLPSPPPVLGGCCGSVPFMTCNPCLLNRLPLPLRVWNEAYWWCCCYHPAPSCTCDQHSNGSSFASKLPELFS